MSSQGKAVLQDESDPSQGRLQITVTSPRVFRGAMGVTVGKAEERGGDRESW